MREVPAAVLARYASLAGCASAPFGTGLINDTFLVEGRGARTIVQRLHPVLSPAVHTDIEAVTQHLAAKGITTPRLLAADGGALWVEHPRDDGTLGVWRAMTFVADTHTWDAIPSPAVAREAGALVGCFHAALADFTHTYVGRKGPAHDTARHCRALVTALDEHRGHRLYDAVAATAEPLLAALATIRDFSSLPLRHGHGDLKVSNLLFDPHDQGVCLVDLDTVGRITLAHEMGDALRSWCNPAGEDVTQANIDVALFSAAIEGYASRVGTLVTREEWESLIDGLATICMELSARFLADALNERYFGWNAARFATRGDHNLARALGQWHLAESVRTARGMLEATVKSVMR